MSLTLDANGLGCVRGGRTLFKNLCFSLREGELLEVSGPNASGKTSLLRMLCGLLAPTAGEILWEGASISSLKEEYLSKLAYLAHSNGLKAELSATENLRIYAGLGGAKPNDESISATVGRMGLAFSDSSPVKTLSQGQQRRVALARLLIADKALWILDEPLTALDGAAVRLVQSVLEKHLEEGGLAVLTTHQTMDVRSDKTIQIQLAPLSEY